MADARIRKPMFEKEFKEFKNQNPPQDIALIKEIKEKEGTELNTQKELDRLTSLTSDLKTLLKESKQRNDELLASYSELQLKHQIIQKEYLNLKYEIGKSTLQNELRIKKSISDKLAIYVKQILNSFKTISSEDKQLMTKLNNIMDDVSRIPFLITENKRASHWYLSVIDQAVHPLQQNDSYFSKALQKYQAEHKKQEIKEIKEVKEVKQQITENKSVEEPSEPIPDIQPGIETEKQERMQNVQIPEQNRVQQNRVQLNPVTTNVIADEYYGDLEEYRYLEEKIKLRKNYQLLKNPKTNADAKRKKIFGGD